MPVSDMKGFSDAVTCRGDRLLDGYGLDGLDLLTTYTQHLELHVITALSPIYILYSSPLHTP
jgi:hypothetical protein